MRDHVSGHPRLVIVSESRPIAYAILGPFLGYGFGAIADLRYPLTMPPIRVDIKTYMM